MSQETYTFACPVCAVRLSVPKALAGVRGPCPQCHHEITAPEPEAVTAVAMAMAAPAAAAPPRPPLSGVPAGLTDPVRPDMPPVPEPPARIPRPASSVAPPPLPRVPSPVAEAGPVGEAPLDARPLAPALPEAVSPPAPAALKPSPLAPPPLPVEALPVPAATVSPTLPAPPPTAPSLPPAIEIPVVVERPRGQQGEEEGEESQDEEPNPPARERWTPPPRRRSGLRVVVAILGVLAMLAAAALNFLPRQSLRHWVAQVWPGAAVPDASGSATPPPPPTDAASSTAVAAASPAAPEPIEIRPALDAPDAPDPNPTAPSLSATEPSVSLSPDPSLPPADGNPEGPATVAEAAAPTGTTDDTTTAAASETAVTPPPTAPTPPSPPAPVATEGAAPSLLPDISTGDPLPPSGVVDEALAGAQEALTLFLQARNWKDRLALCEGGDDLRRDMEAYYAKSQDGPNTPTSVEHIASAPLPGTTRTVQVFHVTFSDLPQGLPVPVRQTDDGWKIDWRAFVEFREGRLKKFLSQYQDGPAVFRVRLQRTQVEDRAVPGIDKKHAFRIAAPIDGHEGYVFVDKEDSIVGPKIADKLDGNTIHLVMAKLKWVRATNGRTYVELRDIVSNSWRETP